jgi:hypothetical protein
VVLYSEHRDDLYPTDEMAENSLASSSGWLREELELAEGDEAIGWLPWPATEGGDISLQG